MLITWESSVGTFFDYSLTTALTFLLYPAHINYFPALAEYQPYVYSSLLFPLLLKHVAQKMKMVWNSSTRSSRLALPRLHILVDYGAFHYFFPWESFSLLKDNIYVITILICDIWNYCEHFCLYMWNKCSWAHMQWIFRFGLKFVYDTNVKELKDKILHKAHNSAYSIHLGGNKMYQDL
jgi:hypothetical protein